MRVKAKSRQNFLLKGEVLGKLQLQKNLHKILLNYSDHGEGRKDNKGEKERKWRKRKKESGARILDTCISFLSAS